MFIKKTLTLINFLFHLNLKDMKYLYYLSKIYQGEKNFFSMSKAYYHFQLFEKMGFSYNEIVVSFRKFIKLAYQINFIKNVSIRNTELVFQNSEWYPTLEHLVYAIKNSAQVREYNFRKILSALPSKVDTHIIDIGSGPGILLSHIYKKWPHNIIISTDINIHCLNYSKKVLSIMNTNDSVHFCKLNALHLPFKSNSVSMIFAVEVIEHVSEPEKLFDEIVRIVKPNGFIICGFPINVDSPTHQHIFLSEQDFFLMTEKHNLLIDKLKVNNITENTKDIITIIKKLNN